MERFIVAEITKNWDKDTTVNNLLCDRFEHVINVNDARGYKLIDWKITSVTSPTTLTETIIAIFESKLAINEKTDYDWFQNEQEELSYTVRHISEDDVETVIAVTDEAEKADFIAKACNQFKY